MITLGKKIGFPTANLSAHSEQFPPNGVYFAQATLNGKVYPGVVNLGYRPTVSSSKSERVLEIHLLDFDHEIYGKDVEVRFIRYLRPEQKFENLDGLSRQIESDVQQARQLCTDVASLTALFTSGRARLCKPRSLDTAAVAPTAAITRPLARASTKTHNAGRAARRSRVY